MLKRTRSLRLASIVGCMLICGSLCFAAPHPKPKAPPKHAGGKSGSKPKPHKAEGNAKQAGSKQGNKKEGAGHEEHKKGLASKEHGTAKEADSKHGSKEKEAGKEKHKKELASKEHEHEHEHEHHEDKHHPDHQDHNTSENVTVNKTIVGGTAAGGPGGVVLSGDAGAAPNAMPSAVAPSLSGRPQLFFSFGDSERDLYDRAAKLAGMDRDTWIRTRLNAAAGR
jgi:hypothetical protein